MNEFQSLGAFAAHLVVQQAKTVAQLQVGLTHVVEHIEKVAKDEIGSYQPAVGPFPAWSPLAESTIADRIHQGFSPDDPLLRTGDLRDSIEHEAALFEGVVGSKSDVAMYQEFGTDTIPPRPFIGPAAFKSKAMMLTLLGVAAVNGFSGASVIDPALGYAFKTG